jgi:hypothetical protein
MSDGFVFRNEVVRGLLVGATICVAAPACLASAFVGGAYYQLGDADPGAVAGQPGNSITQDSFSGDLDLSRIDTPKYSADVPARGPAGDKLSMQFANIGLGGPAFPGSYGRVPPLDASQGGIVLEAWAKMGPSNLDLRALEPDLHIVAANPGLGLYANGSDYVIRIGGVELKLGPAEVGAWHHLGYVRTLNVHSYYYDGNLVGSLVQDPPAAPSFGGFWVGGMSGAPMANGAGAALEGPTVLGFNGWIDEVRYQTFNPIAAGVFDPTAFLISPVPEPTAVAAFMALAAGGILRRRCR